MRVAEAAQFALQGLCAAIPDYAPHHILDHRAIVREALDIGEAFVKALDERFK